MLDLADEVFEHGELGRNLGPADDRRHRLLRRTEGCVQCLQFGFHRATRIGRQQVRQPFGSGMSAVRSAEGVVDVERAVRGDRLGKLGIVCLLARPEAGVVEQADIARSQDSAYRLIDHRPGDFGDEHDFLAEHLFDIADHHAGRQHRRPLPARTAEMRQQQHLGPAPCEFEDGWLHRLDPRHIGGRTILHRQVEIDAHQRNLAGEIGGQIIEGFELGHGHLR